MSIEQNLAEFFKPEERKKGGDLAAKDLVAISSASDTDVRAFVKGSGACRVSLTAEKVAGHTFSADCTCPQSRKGRLCKHVWAVLLTLEKKALIL
ncbi:MAG: hypothetical protein HC883_00675 [Bdellovibrionaceae bacterium]|nr:hypothetical protein [Pseudobdellovibrionaceae bacterium]